MGARQVATDDGLCAVLLVLIVTFSLRDRYRRYGAEAASLLIAIIPWFACRSPFGVREHATTADLCKQVDQVRDLSLVRLCLTLRSPTGTSVHHLCRSYRVANLLSQKKLISWPAFIFLGGGGQSGSSFTLTTRNWVSAVPRGTPRLSPAPSRATTL